MTRRPHPATDRSAATGASSRLDEACAQRLRELGAPSELRTELAATLPWVISVGVHLIGIVAATLVTWAVVWGQQAPDTTLVVADFHAPTLAPATPIDQIDGARLESRRLTELDPAPPPTPPMAPLPGAAPFTPSSVPAATPMRTDGPGERVDFAGIRASNARRIVYVVDASGSMVGTLPIILDELARSIRSLSPNQAFAVIFFQRNQAVHVPPANRLVPATPNERERAIAWMQTRIVSSGRSNPLRALEAALRLRPDVIFLLGHEVTGSGQFEIGQSELLDALDRLNPVHRATGRRAVAINCVQFLDPDPLDTLRRIAEEHGGPDGYRFLDRAQLGIAPR